MPFPFLFQQNRRAPSECSPGHRVMQLLGRTGDTCYSPAAPSLGVKHPIGQKKVPNVKFCTVSARTGFLSASGLAAPRKTPFLPGSFARPSPQAEKGANADLCMKKIILTSKVFNKQLSNWARYLNTETQEMNSFIWPQLNTCGPDITNTNLRELGRAGTVAGARTWPGGVAAPGRALRTSTRRRRCAR